MGERAALGREEARMEGKGVVGQGVDAAKAAATGRVGRRRTRLPGQQGLNRSRSSSLSSSDEEGLRRHHGVEGVRTIVSNEGEAFCPNPNTMNLVMIALLFVIRNVMENELSNYLSFDLDSRFG